MIIVSVFFGIIFALLIADDIDENSIFIENNIFQKYKSDSIVKISGTIMTPFANMTVIFPNGYTVESSVEITRDNSFSSFVYLQSDFESGVYVVSITPYDDSTYDVLVDYFLLTNNDGIVDIIIGKNAAQRCMDMTDNYGNKIENDTICVNPPVTHIPKSFGINFINMDSHTHKMDLQSMETELILPDSNSVIFLDTGVYEYFCVFHPWINGVITVSNIPSLIYDIPILSDNTSDADEKDNLVPIIPQKDIISYPYDTSCTNCYIGVVTKIVDGDTIHVDDIIIRLSLIDTPESYDDGFEQATAFTTKTCPVGMSILVDIDDLQPHDKWKRSMAKITCEGVNLNAALLYSGNAEMVSYFCSKSEFLAEQWGADGCGLDDTPIQELPIEYVIQNNTTIEIQPKINGTDKPAFEIPLVLILIVVVIVVAVIVFVFFIIKSKPNFDVDHNADENFVFID